MVVFPISTSPCVIFTGIPSRSLILNSDSFTLTSPRIVFLAKCRLKSTLPLTSSIGARSSLPFGIIILDVTMLKISRAEKFFDAIFISIPVFLEAKASIMTLDLSISIGNLSMWSSPPPM